MARRILDSVQRSTRLGGGLLLLAALALAPTPAHADAPANAGAPVNDAPAVVPAVQQWTGGTGSFGLRPQSRIVVERDAAAALTADARTFSGDLAAITGETLPVVANDHPRTGDIYLAQSAGHPDAWYGLDIGDVATIRASTALGVFYGEQTVEQLLKTHDSLPQGTATDWPTQAQRGVMLDLGRHYYTPAYVENVIRQAAWYKLNIVHLHLTEASAFRLNSPKFPGLAAAQSYSRADISAFEAVAAKYHVTLVPEIDLPAHATPITNHWPQTTWDCAPMNNERGHNFTVDITKPYTLDVVRQLLDEFIPWFKGPWFHIGGDEYPYQSTQQQCPELVDYAKAHHLGSTSDVFVGFINDLNSIVRAHGKTAVAWGWWDYNATPTIEPDKNIIVEAYGDDVEAGGAAGVHHFLDEGYHVVYANGHQLYATPGLNLLPDDQALYRDWPTVDNPNLLGYLFSRWSDNEEGQPDAYFHWYAERPQAVLADRTWGGALLSNVFAFEDRVDQIGAPPGVPETGDPQAVQLQGTPYGSSPPFDPSSSFDKAYDGDVTTFFDLSQPNGGYTGIDLGAGHAAPVTKIRFVPRANQPGRMTGGHFQGCADGPTSGCHDLATVAWSPTYDWHQLTVTDPTPYRWLRYVSPSNGFGNVAEIQYYTAPATSGQVTVRAPSMLKPLGSYALTTTFTNSTAAPLPDVRLTLQGNSLTDESPLAPAQPASLGAVGPHRSVSVTWPVHVPLGATPGAYDFVGRATYGTGEHPRIVVPSTVAAPITARLDPAEVTPAAGGTATSTLTVTDNLDQPIGLSWTADSTPTVSLHGPSTVLVQPGSTATSTITVAAGADSLGTATVPVHLRLQAGGQSAYGGDLSLTVQVLLKDGRLYLTGDKVLTKPGADWSDYDLSFTAIPYQTGHGGQYAQVGWFFRAQNPTVATGAWNWPGSGYLWLLSNSGAPTLTKIVLNNGDIASSSTTTLPFAITAGTTFQIRTVVRGATFQTYIDGTLVDTTTDSTFPSGRVGFREDGDESASFGQLRVTAPDGQTLFSADFTDPADLQQFDGLN